MIVIVIVAVVVVVYFAAAAAAVAALMVMTESLPAAGSSSYSRASWQTASGQSPRCRNRRAVLLCAASLPHGSLNSYICVPASVAATRA